MYSHTITLDSKTKCFCKQIKLNIFSALTTFSLDIFAMTLNQLLKLIFVDTQM